MVSFNIEGTLAPVFTPICEDGSLNLDIIPRYAEYLANRGVKGIVVGGTTGEFVSLSERERSSALEAWLSAARPLNLKVIAQVGGAPLPHVIEMAKHAEQVKADAIMTLPELYFRPKTAEQLVSYLEVVSRAAPSLPLVYYHFPMMTGVDVNIPNFFSLASSRIPNFKGIKADLQVAVQVANQLSDDRKVFIANHLIAPSVLMGHESSIATVTNMFPELVMDIVEATKSGDVEKARLLQTKLNDLVAAIATEGDFVPAMKAAMEFVSGIEVGPPRLPQEPLDNQRRTRVQEKLRGLGYGTMN